MSTAPAAIAAGSTTESVMRASVAHGCNIGHGLTGLPLLSLGSAPAIAGMAAAALLTWRGARCSAS